MLSPCRAEFSAPTELCDDLLIGQSAGQVANARNDGLRVADRLGPGPRQIHVDVAARTALPADVQDRVPRTALLLDGNVFDEQAKHALAVTGLCRRRMPQAWHILRQRQYLRLLFRRGYSRLLLFEVGVLFFEIFDAQQGVVPATLEGRGNQTLRRIDFLVTSLGERGLILCSLDAHLPLAQHRLIAHLEFLQRRECEFKLRGLQRLQRRGGDRGVE